MGTAAEARGSLQRRPPLDPEPQKNEALSISGQGLRFPAKGAGSGLPRDPHRGPAPSVSCILLHPHLRHHPCPRKSSVRGFRQDLTFLSLLSPVCPPPSGPPHLRGAVSPPSETFLTQPHVLKCRFQGSGRNWSSGSEGLGNLRLSCFPPESDRKDLHFRNTGQGLGSLDKPPSTATPNLSRRILPSPLLGVVTWASRGQEDARKDGRKQGGRRKEEAASLCLLLPL